MSRVSDLLARIRTSLAEVTADRWSDDRLYSLIDEAQRDLARRARLIRRYTQSVVVSGFSEQVLPSDTYLVTKITDVNNTLVPFKTYEELDSINTFWETEEGPELLAVAYNLKDPQRYRSYPIVTDYSSSTVYTFSSVYGFTGTVEGATLASPYGLVVGDAIDDDIYGILVGFELNATSINVYYIAKPANEVTSLSTDLEIHSRYDKAIRHYVVGHAFRDKHDKQNLRMAKEELILYRKEVSKAKKDSSKNYSGHTREDNLYGDVWRDLSR